MRINRTTTTSKKTVRKFAVKLLVFISAYTSRHTFFWRPAWAGVVLLARSGHPLGLLPAPRQVGMEGACSSPRELILAVREGAQPSRQTQAVWQRSGFRA